MVRQPAITRVKLSTRLNESPGPFTRRQPSDIGTLPGVSRSVHWPFNFRVARDSSESSELRETVRNGMGARRQEPLPEHSLSSTCGLPAVEKAVARCEQTLATNQKKVQQFGVQAGRALTSWSAWITMPARVPGRIKLLNRRPECALLRPAAQV